MNDVKITNHQLYTFTALSTLGGSILAISSTIAAVAKQDAWLSVLVNTAYGSVMICIFGYLGIRHQGLTLIGIIRRIFGKWSGSILAAAYVFFMFKTAMDVPWFIGSFNANYMHEMPPAVINMLYVAALVIAVFYGIEAVVRASEMFYVFVTFFFIASIVMVIPNAKLDYMLPVFENGFSPILKGSVFLSSFITFTVISMLMIFPKHVEDRRAGNRQLFKGYIWANTIVFVTIFVSILVLGSDVVARSSFPTVLLAREISIGTVLTRLEYFISIMWTVSEFMVGVLFFYSAVTGLSELLGLKNHKKIVVPMGLIVLLYADIQWPNSVEQASWLVEVWTPHVIVFGAVLPLVMFFVYLFKKRFSK
jgi:spore germination protein KB